MEAMDSEMNLSSSGAEPQGESLFERCHWFYAFCREYLFRDHTKEITGALFPTGEPQVGTKLLELGCGPGVYACKFAQKYPQIQSAGMDLSQRLLERARVRADTLHLRNCMFHQGDAQALPIDSAAIDVLIVSRLFLIVPDKEAVLAEIYRVLRPGGRCFIAEPTSTFRTRIPLSVMWLLARVSWRPFAQFREPQQADVMTRPAFSALVHGQPWAEVEMADDDWYQTAVCVKSAEGEGLKERAA